MVLLHFFCLIPLWCWAVFPIQFSIPECKVVQEIPLKTRDFAIIVPGQPETYIYHAEDEYYRGYQESYYAITKKKGGWDCLRHYEILANGCIPYFIDLDQCDERTMPFLPKQLIWEAMHLEGVSCQQIDHEKFNKKRYYEILQQLLEHTKRYLTARRMGEYLLSKALYSGRGKALFLSCDASPDYLRCLTLIGLKEILQERVIDVPKIPHIYDTCGNQESLYGKGFSYTRIVEDLPIERDNIEERIRNREFELIIYGSVHRGLLFHDLVSQCYPPEKIVYLCGEDKHHCEYALWIQSSPFFLREFEGNCSFH
jgi:hypothetical protein